MRFTKEQEVVLNYLKAAFEKDGNKGIDSKQIYNNLKQNPKFKISEEEIKTILRVFINETDFFIGALTMGDHVAVLLKPNGKLFNYDNVIKNERRTKTREIIWRAIPIFISLISLIVSVLAYFKEK